MLQNYLDVVLYISTILVSTNRIQYLVNAIVYHSKDFSDNKDMCWLSTIKIQYMCSKQLKMHSAKP